MRYITVYPNGDRPHWYAAFPDPKTGKRKTCATEFRRDDPTGRRKALNWAREQAGPLITKTGPNSPERWEHWVPTYLKLKHRNSEKTLKAEQAWWQQLQDFLTERKVDIPRAVTYQLGLDYINWRTSQVKRVSKRNPSFNSALQEVKALSRIMREAIRRGYAEANPLERMGLKKDPPAEKPEITDAEVGQIRAALDRREGHLPWRERWMTVSFEIALHQGCRQRETRLPLESIDLERGTIRLLVKRGRVFTTQLHPDLRPLIERLKAEGAAHTLNFPKMYGKLWHFFFKEEELGHLCFHCTRVTVVTRMARAGVPVQQAMAFVLHADELIHKVYQRLKPEDVNLCVTALAYPSRDVAGPAHGLAQTQGAAQASKTAAGGL